MPRIPTPRIPTPDDISRMITEDIYGQPDVMVPTPVSPAVEVPMSGARGGEGGGERGGESGGNTTTEMRSCMARGCAQNTGGLCCLDSITINKHGGCNEYEATAHADQDDDSRYDEEETDMTGGTTSFQAPTRQSSPY